MLTFQQVSAIALQRSPALLFLWLPGGKVLGSEFVTKNPRRDDHAPGSFSINTKTGRWADFATGDRGGDLVSLRAYLDGCGQGEAARRIRDELGVS